MILVTGAAGFIGSHLAHALLDAGHQVIGIDSLNPYYARELKQQNFDSLSARSEFTPLHGCIQDLSLDSTASDVDVIFHQAGQPGVGKSWGREFDTYLDDNIAATQVLLEWARTKSLQKFVFASTSSVYGDVDALPIDEQALPRPVSPYGVTKLAAENLCHLYGTEFGVPTVSLRYFTVYGPGQRPDMAFHKFLRALMLGLPIEIYGDGRQTRDFTFVEDIVSANMRAAFTHVCGEVFNIGGGTRVDLLHVVDCMERITGIKADLRFRKAQRGDMRHTWADIGKAQQWLGYQPEVDLETGLVRQFEWMQSILQ